MLDGVRRRRLALPESDVEIALLDWGGEGPLALLHHATGFCAAPWALVAEPLRQHFRVVAMDARGHGDSSKPPGAAAYRPENFGRDLAAVAEALAAEGRDGRVALGMGHSFGGTAMLMASAHKPGLFERLVLVDPVVFPPESGAAFARNPLVRSARLRRHLWPSRDSVRDSWANKDVFAEWRPRALELYIAEGLRDRPDGQVQLKCPREVEAAVFELGARFDAWALAPQVAMPTLLLWAERGNFSRELYEGYAAELRDGRVRDIDAGHLAPMERPELVVREALAFAGRNQDSTG